MKKESTNYFTILGLVLLIFSLVLFKSTLKWFGFGLSFTFLLLGLGRLFAKKR